MRERRLDWGAPALWKQLQPLLPDLGVEVVERAASTNSLLLERARVPGRPDHGGADVLIHRSVESSAFGRRAADLQPWLLVAEHQTKGRGRMGRSWQSAAGASLTFSLSLPLSLADWSGLSLAVGVALADALDAAGATGIPRIGLKWPNDLWLLDAGATGNGIGRKLGGVLIETVTAGSARLAVIGIGLNVLPLGATDASSGVACLQELDAAITPPAALARVALPLVESLKRFEALGFAAFSAAYAHRDLLRHQPVQTTEPHAFDGVAQGVSDTGALCVMTDSGLRHVTSGEVSVRLRPSRPAC